MRVLIAEDDPMTSRIISGILTSEGHDIVGMANDGVQAVHLANDRDPDLIILDFLMHEMDGYAALRKIREANPATRILMLSAVSHPQVVSMCLKAGASKFLNKPVDRARLLQAVSEVCDTSQHTEAPVKKSPGKRILIVDDERILRMALRKIIEAGDYEIVGEAVDGEDAVRMAHELRPDLITMDLLMKRMDGLKAIRLIRDILPDIKIIVASSISKIEVITECIRSGASTYLLKPYNKNKVLSSVRNTLAASATQARDKALHEPAAGSVRKRSTLRIHMGYEPAAYSASSGEAFMVSHFKDMLVKRGVSVSTSEDGDSDLKNMDVVHAFGLSRSVYNTCRQAVDAGVPIVATPMYWNENYPIYYDLGHEPEHTQTPAVIEKKLDAEFYEKQMFLKKSKNSSFIAGNAAIVLSMCHCEKLMLCRDFDLPKHKVVSMPMGVELEMGIESPDTFIQAFGVEDFVLCAGPLTNRKNQHMLIDMSRTWDMPLVLIAPNADDIHDEYVTYCRNIAHTNTYFISGVSQAMLKSAFQAARVFAMPGKFELTGYTSLCAAIAKCPIAITERGVPWDYFGAAVQYCNPEDQDSVSAAISKAIAQGYDGSLINDLLSRFSMEDAVNAIIEIYESVL